jgi:hypothetical protein
VTKRDPCRTIMALLWGGLSVRASREVILKLPTQLSFLQRVCNGKSNSSDDEIQRRVVATGLEPKHASRRELAPGSDRRQRGSQLLSICFLSLPQGLAPLISSGTLRTPGTRRSQLGLRGRQVSPRKQWRQLCELDLLGKPEHLEHPDSVPIHVYLVPP